VAVHGFGGSRRGTTARRSRIRKNARCRIHENKVACFRGTYKVPKDGLQAIAEPHLWGKSKTSQFDEAYARNESPEPRPKRALPRIVENSRRTDGAIPKWSFSTMTEQLPQGNRESPYEPDHDRWPCLQQVRPRNIHGLTQRVQRAQRMPRVGSCSRNE
jgi:hypothetical protein